MKMKLMAGRKRRRKNTKGEDVGQKGDQGLRGPPGRPATRNAGVVYTRWGKRTCPTGTALVYSGRVGGSWYCDHGGAANYLCMPDNPDYGTYTPGVQGWG